MARETIGTKDGQQFFVGSDTPAAPPPITRYTTPTATATPTTTPVTPPSPQIPASTGSLPSLQTFDQFSAQRTGGVDENAIRENTRKQMQAQIDATNQIYDEMVRQENTAGEGRLAKVNALNVNSGLSGSNFATSADLTQRDKNSSAVKAVNDERNLKVQEIYGKIDQTAKEEIAAQKAAALGNADAYSTYLEKARTQSQGDLAQLAQAGVDLNQLDPQRRSYLFKAAGYDDQLGELVYNSLKPKAAKIEYKAEKAADGQILLYGVDPVTGQLKQQRVNFNVPEGYDPTYVDGQLYLKNQKDGSLMPAPMDQSLYTPDYKNFLLSKKEGFAGDFNAWQNVDANRKRSVSVTNNNGLSPNQVNSTVNQIAGQFDNEAVVKQFNVINEGYQFAKSLPNDTKNPANDQALIYAYAKAMDPGSVVREGEYATVQKYSQSWIQSFGKGFEQAANGTGFLSADARANIKKTIEAKYNASKTNYQNVYNEYQRQIKDAQSGTPRNITDYSKAYEPASTPTDNPNDPMGLGL